MTGIWLPHQNLKFWKRQIFSKKKTHTNSMDFVNKFKKKLWESVILFISYLKRNVNKYKNNKMLSQYTPPPQIKTFNGRFWRMMVRFQGVLMEKRVGSFIQFKMSPVTWHVKFNSLNYSFVSSQYHDFYFAIVKFETWCCHMKWNLKLNLNLVFFWVV